MITGHATLVGCHACRLSCLSLLEHVPIEHNDTHVHLTGGSTVIKSSSNCSTALQHLPPPRGLDRLADRALCVASSGSHAVLQPFFGPTMTRALISVGVDNLYTGYS
jgi:hypothetical protein